MADLTIPKKRQIERLLQMDDGYVLNFWCLRGRVEGWRGAPSGRRGLSVSPRFLWECLTSRTVSPFPAPATSHAACGFPALRAPAHFPSVPTSLRHFAP